MKIKLSKSQWEMVGQKAGWMEKSSMNMTKMMKETEKLKIVTPTNFTNAFCSFWAGAMSAFKNHLPENHIQDNKNSVEAIEAFKRCFHEGYEPKVETW